ncbi:DUF4294 domain-containing protein [Bacteroides sp. 224]|uniref:DUF4294 domain-containing protein n=1 Tax=Bacteroides sp. 224 TaxID=2302936 RepID=UPI0013D28A23|nr:DUF4294 domain-containing protein [Bacteroides sp. 224]NDV65455.1 DUF4294 domain-containing protein [Bacteroides sp. 224]
MNWRLNLLIISVFVFTGISFCKAQEVKQEKVFLTRHCIYEGDTIPWVQLPTVYIFKPLVFKNSRQEKEYNRLVRNVKKTLPLSKEIYKAVIETYEYMQTLPNEKAKNKHIKNVEKGLKEQYTPIMKKLTFSQGKLLIKLIDRQCNQSSYELVKAFMGPFKAGFYQTFAGLFGASLKKEYDPTGEDKMVERIILMVESGQI